jgi:hypothetical protein
MRALPEMLDAGGLLIFQAANCNHQVLAKLYEYLRAGRPLVALTDPRGGTAALLRAAGIDAIWGIDRSEEIAQGLLQFLRPRREDAPVARADAVAACARRERTRKRIAVLDSLN